MKKILALTLTLIVVYALCACGDISSGETNAPTDYKANNTDSTENTDTSSPNSGETGYVGTWVYEKQTSKGPFKITLVINEDGTATRTVGKTETNLIWYEDVNPDEAEGAIEISREDKKGYGDDAYITEDGKLYLESSGTILDEPYDHLIFDRQ